MELYLVPKQQQSSECGEVSTILFLLILLVGFLLIRVYSLHTKLLDIESQHKMLKTLVSITMEEDEKEMFNTPNSEKVEQHTKPLTRATLKTKATVSLPKTVKPTTETFEELKKDKTEDSDLEDEELNKEKKDEKQHDVESVPVKKIKMKKRST